MDLFNKIVNYFYPKDIQCDLMDSVIELEDALDRYEKTFNNDNDDYKLVSIQDDEIVPLADSISEKLNDNSYFHSPNVQLIGINRMARLNNLREAHAVLRMIIERYKSRYQIEYIKKNGLKKYNNKDPNSWRRHNREVERLVNEIEAIYNDDKSHDYELSDDAYEKIETTLQKIRTLMGSDACDHLEYPPLLTLIKPWTKENYRYNKRKIPIVIKYYRDRVTSLHRVNERDGFIDN
jgi:hypothetical protein